MWEVDVVTRSREIWEEKFKMKLNPGSLMHYGARLRYEWLISCPIKLGLLIFIQIASLGFFN
jgi:hypothetical protein